MVDICFYSIKGITAEKSVLEKLCLNDKLLQNVNLLVTSITSAVYGLREAHAGYRISVGIHKK